MMSSSSLSSGCVTLQRFRAHIAVATLSRPEALNAVNSAVALDLETVVRSTEADNEIWAVVLTGAGTRAFCTGADLKEVSAGRIGSLWTEAGGFAGFVNAERSKVWIAAVEGLALAGGFEIALACDFIVAAENSAFGLPEVTRGMLAAAGGVYRLPRALPRAVAFELIATGAPISAHRAFDLHLVSRITAKSEALAQAIAFAETICANAPIAVHESLRLARRAFDFEDAELSRRSLEAQNRLTHTDDFQEGPRAFVEKRPPVWRGR